MHRNLLVIQNFIWILLTDTLKRQEVASSTHSYATRYPSQNIDISSTANQRMVFMIEH